MPRQMARRGSPAGDRGARQLDLEGVAAGFGGLERGVRRLAVQVRIDVAAAGQHQRRRRAPGCARPFRSRGRLRPVRRRRDGSIPRSRTCAGSGRWRSGAWCLSVLHPRRYGNAHQIEHARQLLPVIRHRGGAPAAHVIAFFVQNLRPMVERVEQSAPVRIRTSRAPRTRACAPPARRRRRDARPRGRAPTARDRRRCASGGVAGSGASIARSSRPSRSCSFWKMLLARTTAYCRYGPLSPSKLSASSMSNAITLVREYLIRK